MSMIEVTLNYNQGGVRKLKGTYFRNKGKGKLSEAKYIRFTDENRDPKIIGLSGVVGITISMKVTE